VDLDDHVGAVVEMQYGNTAHRHDIQAAADHMAG
jgi:hypothetical protein